MTIETDKVLWSCPVCQSPLVNNAAGLGCEHGHQYDMAKQGYVNLLLANQKRSSEPGDSAEMVEARRNFLAAGHFSFLMQAIQACVEKYTSTSVCNLLDLGCGEGAYAHFLEQALPDINIHACDISKYAVKRAASALSDANVAVASNFNLPIQANSQDLVLAVFAPVNFDELQRILKEGGVFVRVSPGEQHLMEIKHELYETAHEHAPPQQEKAEVIETIEVKKQVSLDNSALENLLAMTPLNWRGNADAKARLLEKDNMEVQFDFLIQVMRC
ncbi:MAG: methyltransferase domain-containing protein [Agarilytica sp.]